LGYFGGAILTDSKEFRKQDTIINKIIHAIYTKMIKDFGKTDFRNWDLIASWADKLVKRFKSTS